MVRSATLIVTVAGVVSMMLPPLPAGAQAAKPRLGKCYVGQRVQAFGEGRAGVVTGINGTACTVHFENPLDERAWAAWMLSAADGGGVPVAASGGAPKPGSYQCTGGAAAGNMKLRFGGGNSYANEQGASGTYRMRPSGQMEFVSGPWKGFYGKALGDGRVGLTSKPDGTFYQMTCDPR